MPAAAERWLSLGVAVVCVAVAGLRVWAFGVWRSPDAYLRNPWNILDVFVVIVGILVLVLETVMDPNDIIWLRAFRAMR